MYSARRNDARYVYANARPRAAVRACASVARIVSTYDRRLTMSAIENFVINVAGYKPMGRDRLRVSVAIEAKHATHDVASHYGVRR